ncbi:MAG: tryptophan--tRNA ligase, partial [Algoriella sp.]
GYGHAKQALYEVILEKYADARIRFDELMNDKATLEAFLENGALKARVVAQKVLKRTRTKLGLK